MSKHKSVGALCVIDVGKERPKYYALARADDARGFESKRVQWLRQPTNYERDVVLAGLVPGGVEEGYIDQSPPDNLKERALAAGLLDENQPIGTLRAAESQGAGGKDIFGYGHKPIPCRDALEALRPGMLRVESDGTPEGTDVFVGDTRISAVQGVKWEVKADSPLPMVTVSALSTGVLIREKQKAPAEATEPPQAGECWATFRAEGSYPGQREHAKTVLTLGKRYRVIGGSMGGSHTNIVLANVSGVWNSAMFDIEGTLPFTYEDSYTTGR